MGKTVVSDDISNIASGVEIVGNIVAEGRLRLEGKIKGNIKLSDRLVVDAKGVIEGDLECKEAQISGKVDGKITVKDTLEFTSTAVVHGQIVASKLVVAEGAIFTGTCDMDTKPAASPAPEK